MRVEMKAGWSSPERRLAIGQRYDLPEPLARHLIAIGSAIPAGPVRAVPKEPEPEKVERPILSLALPGFVLERLQHAGLRTVEDLERYIADGNDLTDITGIGKATAEKITQALEG